MGEKEERERAADFQMHPKLSPIAWNLNQHGFRRFENKNAEFRQNKNCYFGFPCTVCKQGVTSRKANKASKFFFCSQHCSFFVPPQDFSLRLPVSQQLQLSTNPSQIPQHHREEGWKWFNTKNPFQTRHNVIVFFRLPLGREIRRSELKSEKNGKRKVSGLIMMMRMDWS